MAAETKVIITGEDRSKQAFSQAENSLESLERQSRELQGATRATAQALGLTGNAAQEAGAEFTTLGRQIFRTQEEAKRAGGVFRSLDGRLREANGRFVKGREAVEDWNRSVNKASSGAGILTRSVGSLGGALSAIGIASATALIGQFASASVDAAAQLEGFERGLRVVEKSRAPERLAELIQVANLPGLNLTDLIQFSNRLRVIGLEASEVDKILQTTGGVILAMGGNSRIAAEATLQLVQAIETNTVSLQDFRSIAQRVPGFYSAIADTHGVQASIDGFRDAVDATGGSVANALLPVMDTLAERFGTPPSDSYVVAMDELQNSFFLTQSAIGGLFLPALTDAAFALSNFLENVREGVTDVSALPQPLQDIVAGTKNLYDALLEAASVIANNIGPEMREFAASLGTLLGGVLDLAGSIVNVLEPAFQLWSHVQAVIIAAITKLAQDINSIIGVLTDFVDWVASAWQGQDRLAESTERVAAAIENVEKATKGASVSIQDYQRDLTTLLRELASVNSELEEKKAKLEELKEKGLTPADASMAQIERRIALLEERSKSLTASLPDLKQALEDVNKQLEDKKKRLDEMTGESETANASAEQLERQIANLTTLSTLLNAQIANTTTALTETVPATETAAKATENYGLTLARLKATAEDARETLSNTINFEQIGENYQAAIALSDAYYNRQIANAREALSQAKENSDEYQKIETDIFNLQRERQEARKKITEQASAVARTETERRIEIANEEKERLQKAAEETARALAASQKKQADTAEAEQKRLTQVHQENLKQREEAQRQSDERIVQNSEEQLSILQNAFENSLPAGVDTAYQSIQNATIQHYETLKDQARQRITDEDALNAELVSLDRQRNAALEENHRNYLQRIASDAKNLLGERTESFKTASDDILHNWERTVSEFERQLREADTEDAIREIEAEFASGQKNMLASLQAVLTELGFTAEQTAEIMKEIFRTAESESDSFADKVISAFKRLGKEVERETKRQNREIEKNYRELVSQIENILSGVTDFFKQIARGVEAEDAFKDLGTRLADSFLEEFTTEISKNLAAQLAGATSGVDISGLASAGTGASARTAGTSGGLLSAGTGGITGLISLITSPVALAAIVPAAVGAATYYIGRQVAGGTSGQTDRLGRDLDTLDDDRAARRRRGESQAAYENRLQSRADAEAAEAQRQAFFGNYDPRAPFGRAIQETGIFTGDSGYFAESALRLTEVDLFGNIDLPGLVEDLEGILQTRVEGLGEDMERAAAALESASVADLKPALDEYFSTTTDFYQTQIDFANFVRRTTGHLDFGDAEGLARELQESLNQARLSAPPLASSSRYNLRQRIQQRQQEGATEDIARAQYGAEAYDAEVTEAESIVPVIESINEGIELINASILSTNTQIEQSNDPAEISQLLSRVPDLISEKYKMLRQALEARFNAGEISEAGYNASLSELQSNEARELEQHSDAVLSNTLRTLNEDVQLIDASISSIQTQIAGLSEPEVIVGLLNQLPALITEKYQKLREALDEKYAAGEISVDVYNASLTALATTEASETERHSDAVLAQTLADIDDDVELIDANIGALQLAVENSDDPESIAGLLDAIKLLVADKYKHLRERLDELYAAEEISTDSYNAALTGLSTAESRALADLDTQALNAISTEAQEQANFINGAIENLRLSLQLTDDPAETQRILDAIRVLTASRFDVLIEELNAIKDTLTDDEFSQALKGLELGKQVALDNIDTEKFDAISAEAQQQVGFINGNIENLRLSLQLTDDPEESQQILDVIKVLTSARFAVLRDELHAIRDTLKPEEFEQALKGLNLSETLALANLDTEKFDAISAEAQNQVNAINTDIENLRLSLQLTDDPAERQQILDAIRVLTVARFSVLREELENIKDSLDPEDFARALKGINLGEQVALSNLDTETFDEISAEAMRQVDAINGTIENLRLALQLTDDPAETQRILDAIKILTAARFDVLIQELHDIRETLSDEDFNRALTGLELGKQVALSNINTEKFNALSAAAQKQVTFIEGAISNLELALQLTDDPEEIQRILASIRVLTAKRFDRLIQELHAVRDSFENDAEFNQALKGLQLGKAVALKGIDDRSAGVAVERIGTALGEADTLINDLLADLAEQTTAFGIKDVILRLYNATEAKYTAIRSKINASAESETEKARQIEAANRQESQNLARLGRQELDAFSSLVDTARFLLDGATEAEFASRREALVTAINEFYDERLAFVNTLDLSDTDRENMQEVVRIQRRVALEAIPQMHASVEERLELEQDLQKDIADLRDDALDAERDRHEQLIELEEKTQDRILDIQRKATRSKEDIEREFQRDYQDIQRERFDAQNEILQDTSLSGEERAKRLAELDNETTQRLQSLGRERLEDLEDVDIRQGRDREDIDRQFAEQRIIAEQQSAQTQAELSTQIAALTQELGTLREGEPTDPTVSVLESETAPILKEAATSMQQTAPIWQETAEGLKTVADNFMSADIPGLFEAVASSIDVQTRIAVSMERLPTLLEESFEQVFKDLSDTFLELTQIETGIRKGAVIELYEQFPELLPAQQQPLVSPQTQPVLGPLQTTPIASTPDRSTEETGGLSGGGTVSVHVVGGTISVSNLGEQPVNVNSRTTVELDGDKVTETVENNVVSRRAEGRSLLND